MWNDIVVLICISMMVHEVQHLFMHLFVIYFSFLEKKCLFIFFNHVLATLFVLLLLSCRSPHFFYQLQCGCFHDRTSAVAAWLISWYAERELVCVLLNWYLHGVRRVWSFVLCHLTKYLQDFNFLNVLSFKLIKLHMFCSLFPPFNCILILFIQNICYIPFSCRNILTFSFVFFFLTSCI